MSLNTLNKINKKIYIIWKVKIELSNMEHNLIKRHILPNNLSFISYRSKVNKIFIPLNTFK